MFKQYTKKDGTKWWLFKTYLGQDPITGKKKYTTKRGFKTKKEAKIALSKLQMDIERNGLPTKKTDKTFEEVYTEWLDSYQNTVKESTFVMQRGVVQNHILPTFGQIEIAKINTAFCQKQANHWRSYYKKYSNVIGLTNSILEFARLRNYIDYNPMKNVVRPKKKEVIDEENPLDNFYTKKDLNTFLEIAENNYDIEIYTMFLLLAYTGIRKGELLGLRWKDIDFKNNTISIKQTLTTGLNNKLIFQTPKTKKSLRTIPLDNNTMAKVKRWKLCQKPPIYNYKNTESSLVFQQNNNEPKYLDFVNHNLKIILTDNDLPKITVHGFRHTHCTLLFEAGASIKEVQDRLGHTDIKTTMEIYTHVTKKSQEKTASKFADFLIG